MLTNLGKFIFEKNSYCLIFPEEQDRTSQLFLFIRFTTTFTIMSFSSVRLSAIMSVRATRVLSAMRFVPSGPELPPAALILNTAARSGLC